MNDIKYYRFKEQMLQRAMELWGIQDRSNIDPVIELFIDVFAYEISKIHHEIKASDNQLLDRLSRILVSKKWALPRPAHALLRMEPENEDEVEVTRNNRFYTTKRIKGGESIELGFAPLYSQNIIKAEITYLISGQTLARRDQLGLMIPEKIFAEEDRLPDYELLVGIKIDSALLDKLSSLDLCILTDDTSLASYLSIIEAYDITNNKLKIKKSALCDKPFGTSHYEQDILDYYSDYMCVIDFEGVKKERTDIESIGIAPQYADIINDTDSYFWVKLKFPETFSKEKLTQVSVYLNTIPVVNKDLKSVEHNLRSKGRIVPLRCRRHNCFLNVESLKDNFGESYCNLESSYENSKEGTYSLYFGELEKFDNRSAKEIVNKALQALREEGSSFYSLDADNVETHLSNVGKILDELEQIFRSKNVGELYNEDRAYLLTTPLSGTFNYGVEYWVTNADLANGISTGTPLHSYKTDAFKETAIRLVTDTVGGDLKKNEQDRINGLRYGLLTRDRLVSSEDIKSFVHNLLGNRCENVLIKNGVEVSNLPTGGLLRTINIQVTLKDNLSSSNKTKLEYFIQKSIEKKSVLRSNYRVEIIN